MTRHLIANDKAKTTHNSTGKYAIV